MLEYIDNFRTFVKENLPVWEDIPYLVMTPSTPNVTRCIYMARRYKDPIHLGIVIPTEAQEKLNQFFSETRLESHERDELYEAWINDTDSVKSDYILQKIPVVKKDTNKPSKYILSFIKGTHRYSFYL